MPGNVSIDDAMRLALAHHQAGRLSEAEQLYRRVLETHPNQAQAMHHLGVIALQRGRSRPAAELIERALEAEPSNAAILTDLAVVYRNLGRLNDAEQLLRRALVLAPDRPEIHNNLGNVLRGLKNLPEAEACFRRALTLRSDYLEALNNLGNALIDLRRYAEAEQCFRSSLALSPDHPESLCYLGVALQGLERMQDAERFLRRAIQLRPDYAEAHHNLGGILRTFGRLEEAGRSARRALDLSPSSAEAHCGMGDILVALGRQSEAEQHFLQALTLQPEYTEAHNNLANLLRGLGRLQDAEKHYRQALVLSPEGAGGYSNLGSLLTDMARHDEAEECYRRALLIKPDFSAAHSNLIFLLDLFEGRGIEEQQAERRRWYAQHGRKYAADIAPHENSPVPNRKLRIGYVSADFRQHSAYYAIAPVICNHDHTAFEVYCYSGVTREDHATERLKAASQHWRSSLGISDSALAEQVRSDGIDILVDLAAHSAGNRLLLFARKPAPIQVTAWGYGTGTGLQTMDYFFTDPVLVQESERSLFAEEIIDLPCIFCYEAPPYAPAVSQLPSLGGRPFTFGCVNRTEKISDKCMELWGRIMTALPKSELLLKDRKLDDTRLRANLLRRLGAVGIGEERIRLAGGSPHAEHLEIFDQIDVGLDPFPHGGGISTTEALWMGVPVVTLLGRTPPGRASASILTALRMQGWIAETEADYARIAVKAASGLQRLATLRQKLRKQMTETVIGDGKRYTIAVERAYRSIWQRWCNQHAAG